MPATCSSPAACPPARLRTWSVLEGPAVAEYSAQADTLLPRVQRVAAALSARASTFGSLARGMLGVSIVVARGAAAKI